MFRRRPRPYSRLNYLICLTIILTVLMSLCALGPTGAAGGIVPTAPLVAGPTNDNFANAQPILGASGVILGSNVGATKEPLEPNHAGRAAGASVWYRWQAPFNGDFVFTTFQTSFSTVLAVYTGNNLPGTLVKANDAESFGCLGTFGIEPASSRVAFTAVGGVVYHIAIDTRSGTTGNIRLRWGRSASILGGIREVNNLPSPDVGSVELSGDVCRVTEFPGAVVFHEIPTNGSYTLAIKPPPFQVANFEPLNPPLPSISPLPGSVTNYTFLQTSPTASIKGTVKIPNGDTTGITVMCDAALFSKQASDLGAGVYQCSSLPIHGNYVVTPSKLGYRFERPSENFTNLTKDFFDVDFMGIEVDPHTISGKVTDADGTSGMRNVRVNLSGSQIASQITNTNGDYTFTVPHGGDYTITPSDANLAFTPPSISFGNLSTNQTANFTATFLIELVLDNAGQVVALDSMLNLSGQFSVINLGNLLNTGVDRNTRVKIFTTSISLAPGETASSVVINLIGSNSQSYNIPAEDVRPLADTPYSQIIFRLPDSLTPGTSTLVVKVHGLTSNVGSLKIIN